eukprot:2127755-Rhodomonas_salina.5
MWIASDQNLSLDSDVYFHHGLSLEQHRPSLSVPRCIISLPVVAITPGVHQLRDCVWIGLVRRPLRCWHLAMVEGVGVCSVSRRERGHGIA